MKKLIMLIMVGVLFTGCATVKDSKGTAGKFADSKISIKDEVKKDRSDHRTKKKENNREKISTTKDKDTSSNDKKVSNIKKKSTSKSNSNTTGKTEVPQNNVHTNTGNKNEQPNESSTPAKPVETPPAQEPEPALPVNQAVMATQVFNQINAYRVQNGKQPFQLSVALQATSEAHAQKMASIEGLWHSGDAVECITNADNPFNAWVNSPPHNEILLCNNTEGAVGIYYYNGYYYSVFQCQYRQ